MTKKKQYYDDSDDDYYMAILRSRRPHTDTTANYIRGFKTTEEYEPKLEEEDVEVETPVPTTVELTDIENEAGSAPPENPKPLRGRRKNENFFIKFGSNNFIDFKNKSSAVDYIHHMSGGQFTKAFILEKLNQLESEDMLPNEVSKALGFSYTRDKTLYKRGSSVPPVQTPSKRERMRSVSPFRKELIDASNENIDRLLMKLQTPTGKKKLAKTPLPKPVEVSTLDEDELDRMYKEFDEKSQELGLEPKPKPQPLPQRQVRAQGQKQQSPTGRGRGRGKKR